MTPDAAIDAGPLEHLKSDPTAFGFDAAIRILLRAAATERVADAVRFVSPAGLAFAPGDVLAVDGTTVTLGLLGLVGPGGVLPRRYTEHAASEGGGPLHAWLDLLAHRMLASLAEAGVKYRLDRSLESARLAGDGERPAHVEALLAIAGFAETGVKARLPFAGDALMHYAGLFALRPRSAERLGALASDWLGLPVTVVEFGGAWLSIGPDQRTRLGGARSDGVYSTLGRDAAIGTRVWDPQARITLRVGPLDQARFEALLPGQPALRAFVSLVRAFVGFEVEFGVNLVLAADDVPAVKLDSTARPGPMLGWNTWLERGKGYRTTPIASDVLLASSCTV